MECVKWGDWQQTKVPGTRGRPARVRLFLRAEKGYLPSSWGALVLDGCCPGEMSNYRLQQDCSILFGFDLHLIISCTCYSTSTDVELNTIQEPILIIALHKIKSILDFRWNKLKNKAELTRKEHDDSATTKSYTNRLRALCLAYFHPISHTDSKPTPVL